MICKLLVLAEGMSIDGLTHQMTIYGILDALAAPTFPIVIPRAFIGCVFEREEREPQNAQIMIRLLMDNMVALQAPANVEFGDQMVARLSAQVGGIFIPGPCRLALTLVQGEVELGRYELGARLVPAAPHIVGAPEQAPGPVPVAPPPAGEQRR